MEMYSASYSMVVLYVRDHGGLGFSAQKYHLKNQTHFSLSTVWQHWLGIAKPKCVQINPKPFQQVDMKCLCN